MDLEKLQQEIENLQHTDITKLPPDQLSQLLEKLSSIMDKSDELLLEINKTENKDETNNS